MKARKAIAGIGIALLTVIGGINLAAAADVSAPETTSITLAGKKGGSGDWWP